MKIRRVRVTQGVQVQTQDAGGSWRPTDDDTALGGRVFDRAWELARVDEHLQHSPVLLPFQPVSFRDFMLYEQHVLDASRGLVQRFHPGQYRIVETVEALTRRTFPLLKPKPLFYAHPMYYMSRSEHLYAGELFATGTLPGGSGMETGHWLRAGDKLELTIDGIGRIEHAIIGS